MIAKENNWSMFCLCWIKSKFKKLLCPTFCTINVFYFPPGFCSNLVVVWQRWDLPSGHLRLHKAANTRRLLLLNRPNLAVTGTEYIKRPTTDRCCWLVYPQVETAG